jgi:hypothetical protein
LSILFYLPSKVVLGVAVSVLTVKIDDCIELFS